MEHRHSHDHQGHSHDQGHNHDQGHKHDHNHTRHLHSNDTMGRMHEHIHRDDKEGPSAKGPKVPVTVIGGFLGSGKTTHVNHLIKASDDTRVDVIVREFGSISIDDLLVHLPKDRVHVFPGVSMHHDPQLMLYGFLDSLYERYGKTFDSVLMESSGLDKPEDLVQLFFLGDVAKNYRLGSYIAIVSADYGNLDLDEYRIAREQAALADVVIINKTDLADEAEVDRLEERIRGMNMMARIIRAKFGEVDPNMVTDIGLHEQLEEVYGRLMEGRRAFGMDDIRTIALTETRPMDKEKVNAWLQSLFMKEGTKMLRSKGFFNFQGFDDRFEFQAVRKTFHSKADRKWEDGEERKSVIVVIGEGLPEEKQLQESFSECAYLG